MEYISESSKKEDTKKSRRKLYYPLGRSSSLQISKKVSSQREQQYSFSFLSFFISIMTQTFHSNLHYFNATDITLLLLLLFSTWDINPPQIFNSLSSNRATTFRDSFLLEIYGTAFCAHRSILSRIFHYATCKDD